MIKRITFALLIAAVLFLTGCPAPLITGFPSDLVLMLGLFSPADGVTTIRGALGGSIDVPVLIADQTGREATGSYDVTFTLSADADLATTGDNIDAGVSAVVAGSTTVISIDVPVAAVAAAYTLFGEMAATDAILNNNRSSVAVDIGATNSADLEITIGAFPMWADPGTTITIGYSVANTGYARVPSGTAFDVHFTVVLGGTGEIMGSETITLGEDLFPQDQVTSQLTITLPTLDQMAIENGVNTTELDDYSVDFTATVDVNDTVVEIVESGTDTFTVESGNRKPDLVLDDIVLPGTFIAARAGSPALLTIELRNDGAAATGEYTVDLYVDIDTDGSYLAGTDIMLHQWAEADTPVVPYDLAGTGNNRAYLYSPASVVYPVGTTPGIYDIRAEIVTTIDEYNTWNNDETEFGVEFMDALFNLAMGVMSSDLTAGIDEVAGGAVPLTYTLTNDGEDDVTGAFSVEFYATANNVLNPGVDLLLGTDAVDQTIPAGGSLQRSFTGTFPGASGAAFYTLHWVIDSTDAIAEFDETDNTPVQPEDCFVFPIVSDGVTPVDAQLLAYKPLDLPSVWTYVEIFLYDTPFTSSTSALNGAQIAGTQFLNLAQSLNSGQPAGIQAANAFAMNDIQVAFRLVPDHVDWLPAASIPSALLGQDQFESNDIPANAADLSGANNPLYGFVTVWLDNNSGDDDDYFLFDVP